MAPGKQEQGKAQVAGKKRYHHGNLRAELIRLARLEIPENGLEDLSLEYWFSLLTYVGCGMEDGFLRECG